MDFPISTLFKTPGLRLEHIAVDSMHAGDLGVFQDFVGSVMDLDVRFYNTIYAEGVRRLNKELDDYYAANPKLTSATPISASQLSDTDAKYPTFKSKAAECRHITKFVQGLVAKHAVGKDDAPPFSFGENDHLHDKLHDHITALVACANALLAYHESCSATPFDSTVCKESLMVFLNNYAKLHFLWREDQDLSSGDSLPFHMRPKAHMLQHLVLDKLSLWGSPSEFWCYGDEDACGRIKRIASRTHHMATIEQRIMEKIMVSDGLKMYAAKLAELAEA